MHPFVLALLIATAPAAAAGVVHVPADQVSAAFAKGAVLLKEDGFEIHASRRDAPGRGEVHAHQTDIIHVLEGTATFVTGGRLVDPQESAPGELRGSAIEGGDARELRPGDVIVVPRGVPHWFSRVDGPFVYHVVKVG